METPRRYWGKFSCSLSMPELIYYEHYRDIRDAIARESQLKKWSRAKKINLLNRTRRGTILALTCYKTRNIERFDSLAPASLSLRPCRPCRGFPSRSILDSGEFTLSGVEGLEMTDILFVRVQSVISV